MSSLCKVCGYFTICTKCNESCDEKGCVNHFNKRHYQCLTCKVCGESYTAQKGCVNETMMRHYQC
jgi:hypothetical protein